ncbi:uncharacterized protein ColSpa_10101 [Colletotrichum spaethianum]|uniref:C3H1-type domain-containing protein n=1 Tax=Colletotrichum spaethianum TaxID=700344 RepID=A0AA37UP38_9PEZI|nr:uncharacterized protein ColSpa_10101 [Colletotrichum spaethianum]GKT49920.1 hypothetical protein ColSpa_10101 [Colletotrichum spaethianum]
MPTTTHTTTRVTSGSNSYLDNINANTNAAPVLPPYLRTSSQSPLNSFLFSPSNAFPSAIGTGIPKERTGATKMSLNNTEIMDFVTRYQTLQGYQNASDQLIKDLLIYCKEVEGHYGEENHMLKQELRNAKLDLEHATTHRREMQQALQELDLDNNYIKDTNLRGLPYQFQENFIRQGIEGGKQAAYALRTAVAEYVGSQSGEVEIVAKVCANLSGLGRAMRRDGCLDSESALKDFSLGFTQAKASFDFIDVGHGKERADSKIKEATRWHLRNYNCRQILLGISHDAGYAPFLDEILQDKEIRSKVSIIEGVATVRELKNTNVHILDPLPSLFRNQKLVDRSGDRAAEAVHPKPLAVVTTSPTVSLASPATSVGPIVLGRSHRQSEPPPVITTPLANKSINIPTRQASQPKPQASQPKLQTPTWNPGQRGLDPPIPINQPALDNIKKRTGRDKLCNNHYLRGPCAKGDECCFEHKYKPNPDEINAIALLTRLNPCTNGQDCDVENCIYGHHCPSVTGNTCTHPYCKFRISDHPPGTKFKNAKIHEN